MAWIVEPAGVPMEAIVGAVEIRAVIREPHPAKPPEQGYDFRFSFRRPPTVPGGDTPIEWTPWMFVSTDQYERLIALMSRYMHTQGHLSQGDMPPPGQLQ